MSATWGTQSKYGDYEIVGARENNPRLLGEGSFGKTFEGMRTDSVAGASIREYVAIKVLNPKLLTSKSKVWQFTQELQALTKFKHSNLIHYIRCGEENGEVYCAMELCRGGDLQRLVRRFGRLPEKAAALIGLQVAAGLREVHQRHRLVHRDIKPSNIMLVDELERELEARHLAFRFEQQDSLCRVVDFGLVNFIQDTEDIPQAFVGSPMYASPEQIRQQPVDGRSDIYSLGMTLWYLVQGNGPMLDDAGNDFDDMREAMRRHTTPDPHDAYFPEHLSPEFRQLLSQMVAKDASKRFSNAGELQTALREFIRTAVDAEAEPAFSVTRLTAPIDTVYDIGERISSRAAEASFFAIEKNGGQRVKLSVAANLSEGDTSRDVEEVTARVAKLAALSRQPFFPAALYPIREVIQTDDVLAYTEELESQVALAEVLKARAGAKRPMAFSEAVHILRPIAEALDFLLQQGQEIVFLACEEVFLSADGAAGAGGYAALLTKQLEEWPGLRVHFSMACRIPKGPADPTNSDSTSGETMSGSVSMSGTDLHPVPTFARLVYRILNGSEVAAAVQFTPYAYVPAVTLCHASNNLLRDILSKQKEWVGAVPIYREMCANEGVVSRSHTASSATSSVARSFPSRPDSKAPGSDYHASQAPTQAIGQSQSLRERLTPAPSPASPAKVRLPSTPAQIPIQTPAPAAAPSGPLISPRPAVSVPAPVAAPPPLPRMTPPPVVPPATVLTSTTARRGPGVVAILGGLAALAFCVVAGAVGWHVWSGRANGGGSGAPAFEGKAPGEAKTFAGVLYHWCPPTGPQGFLMGSPESEPGRAKTETQHSVQLTRGYWMSETEVTQGQWQQVMGTGLRGQVAKALADETTYTMGAKRQTIREATGVRPGDEERLMGVEGADYPISWVNWQEATDYCKRLTDSERAAGRLPAGWELKLPTEAQWEYACRAGVKDATYVGEMQVAGRFNSPTLDPVAWYGGNSGLDYHGRGFPSNWNEKQYEFTTAGPRSVGHKQKNPWQLSDMLGNVSEMCMDWHAPFSADAVKDPQGPATGRLRVQRGGSWGSAAAACRAAARGDLNPSLRTRYSGFRPVLAPETPRPASTSSGPEMADESQEVAAPSDPFAGTEPGASKSIGGIPFHWCPPTGSKGFAMGSPAGEVGRFDNEVQHQVVLTRGFWIAETEVTLGQWQELMGSTLRQQAAKTLADDTLFTIQGKRQTIRDAFKLNKGDEAKIIGLEAPEMPIYYVNWNEADQFCRRLTGWERAGNRLPTGWEVRLPTEAQWEYAARAGTTTATYAGDLELLGRNNAPILDPISWYGGNSGYGYSGIGFPSRNWQDKQYQFDFAGPRVTGQRKANPWHLRDVIGDLAEWCADRYGNYGSQNETDPRGPAVGFTRAIRGASWSSPAAACRAAWRAGSEPGLRQNFVGFRPVVVQVDERP